MLALGNRRRRRLHNLSFAPHYCQGLQDSVNVQEAPLQALNDDVSAIACIVIGYVGRDG